MRLSLIKLVRPLVWSIVFVVSAALAGYASWLHQIDRGDRAYRAGDFAAAADRYASASAPFRAVPWLAYAVRADFAALAFHRVAALYAGGKYGEADAALREAAARAPFVARSGDYSYWLGNLYFRSAAGGKTPQDFFQHLKSALEEYRRGLHASPEHWDLKYNYELTARMLSQGERNPQEQQQKAKSLLDLLRPPRDPAGSDLPPEKRG